MQLDRKITRNTCVLLISQSGQTFSTLHATHKLSSIVRDKLWILTGCSNSKMESSIIESYKQNRSSKEYNHDRVILNLSGHRPAEPSSVAVTASWHSLTRILMHIILTTRALLPSRRLIHDWIYDRSAVVIQTFFRRHIAPMRIKLRAKQLSSRVLLPLLSNNYNNDDDDDEVSKSNDSSSHDVHFANKCSRSSSRRSNMNLQFHRYHSNQFLNSSAHSNNNNSINTNQLDISIHSTYNYQLDISAHSNNKNIVDYEPLERNNNDVTTNMTTYDNDTIQSIVTKKKNIVFIKPIALMHLTDGCIKDFNSLLMNNLLPNICSIVGKDVLGKSLRDIEAASSHSTFISNGLTSDMSVHDSLVHQGEVWAEHIDESWKVLVLAGTYIILSVGLGLPIFGLIGDLIVLIIRACSSGIGSDGSLAVSFRRPSSFYNQTPVWIIFGFILQFLDAIFFVYLSKHITRLLRYVNHRPYYARYGKRTIVIVDSPTNHQLLENFVSKLYSQAYSIVSVDVHGASGLDHFVHRFTHRVVRGVLIAVGRPDGRLCCLGETLR
jgi:hypothetical protein